MDWREKAKELAGKIQKYREDKEGWKQAKKSKDVTIWWKPSPDWSGALYKSETVIDSDPETVFSFIDPIPESPRVEWDKAIKELQKLKELDKDLSISRYTTHSAFGGLISSRDFVDLVLTVRNDSMISTNAMGVDYSDCQATSEHVRGNNLPCSIACHKVPEDPNKTRIECFIQTDLGGMLPKQLVETALPSNMVDFASCLKKALQEGGHLKVENGTS
eukprot:GHVU01152152.1.p1 GENE.GHVU01152152.1~~GHVU01152152.1.p1  ORF type:complete len:218 (-),score=31.94 GHVU01152152.1:1598-2251(-)